MAGPELGGPRESLGARVFFADRGDVSPVFQATRLFARAFGTATDGGELG
jgi:hypothetical protein